MKLELEVLASTTIKRKKPWPRLAWAGELQESVLLMDRHRLSILYIPSGKTKRNISKLQPLMEDVLAMAISRSGHVIGGLLRSGNLFLWHKDSDILKRLHGFPELGTSVDPGHLQLFLSPDGSRIVVIHARSSVFVWEADQGEGLFSSPREYIRGLWTQVLPSGGIPLPEPDFKETSIDAIFHTDSALGSCCTCTFVFNTGTSVCVSTLLLRWMEPHAIHMKSAPTYRAEWTSIRQPLRNVCDQEQPLRVEGAYLARQANDGHLVAVAVNRKCSHDNRMMFVSSLTDTVVIRDLLGCGTRSHVMGAAARRYWVCEVQWSSDDLLVICMTEQGSLCILSRLGEPLLLQTCGHNMDMGPKCFLPLHPRISVQSTSNHNNDLSDSDQDPMRQQFSVAVHPRLPIILCSDGYLVTALQLPGDSSCLGIMKGLLMESTGQLKLIRDKRKSKLHLVKSFKAARMKNSSLYGQNGGRLGLRLGKQMADKQRSYPSPHGYSFEEPDHDALNGSMNDDLDGYGSTRHVTGVLDMDNGRIMFGDAENINNSAVDIDAVGRTDSGDVVDLLLRAERTLLCAWSLGCSHTGLWTSDHEEVASQLVYNLAQLCTLLLHASTQDILTLSPHTNVASRGRAEDHTRTLHLTKVLGLVKTLFHLLRLDSVFRHMMVSVLRLASSIVSVLVATDGANDDSRPVHTLHGCYVLLNFIEHTLLRVYTDLPQLGHGNACPGPILAHFQDLYQPCVLAYTSPNPWGIPSTPRSSIPSEPSSPRRRLLHAAAPDNTEVPSETDDYAIRDRLDGNYLDVSSEAEDYKMQKMVIGSESGPPEYTSKSSSTNSNHYPRGPYQGWRRLAPAWKLLYTYAIRTYKELAVRKGKKKKKMDALMKLMASLQCRLQILGTTLLRKKSKIYPGERLCIEGCGAPAMQAWVHTLHRAQDAPQLKISMSRVLHGMLYTLLMQSELRGSVELVELMIRQQDIQTAAALFRQDHETKCSVLTLLQQTPLSQQIVPPCYIQSEAVRALVQSMARIMAAYFTNTQVFIYPPHSPKGIPPLHSRKCIARRIIPLYPEHLTSVLRQPSLANVWTPARALEYLLLAGLLVEAVWFAHHLGDWKTAFLIAAACQERPPVQSKSNPVPAVRLLPPSLQPVTLLQAKLEDIFTVTKDKDLLQSGITESALHPGISDLLLAGAVSHTDITPVLLENLLTQIKVKAKEATLLVCTDFYLPAPPIYCPQPPPGEKKSSIPVHVEQERCLRSQISSLIRLYLLVLNCARCTLPTARWYAEKVQAACQAGQKVKGNMTLEEPDVPVLTQSFLDTPSCFLGNESDIGILRVVRSYRDLCAIVWMFHVRDKLSVALREKVKLSQKRSEGAVLGSEWDHHIRETLRWAGQLLPFTRHIGHGEDMYGLLLSLIIEQPMNPDTATLLAQFFYDSDSLSPETQDKLQAVLKDWQGVFLDKTVNKGSIRLTSLPGKSPRGVTMSGYFHKQTRRTEHAFRKKAHIFGEYEVFVFDPETEAIEAEQCHDEVVCVGGRPHESDWEYLRFLDTLYAVCFHKEVDMESQMALLKPRLLAFAKDIRKRELNTLAHKVVANLQRKTSPQSTATKAPVVAMPIPKKVESNDTQPPVSPRTKVGLFRSRSFSELHTHKRRRQQQRPQSASSIRRSSSQNDIDRTVMPGKLAGQKGAVDVVLDAVKRMRDSSRRGSGSKESGQSGPQEDPLTNLVLPPWLLEQIYFGPAYATLERLMGWLSRWSRRHHMLGEAKDKESASPVIRLQPHPQLLVYAVWQQESRDQQLIANSRAARKLKTKKKTKTKKKAASEENINNNQSSENTNNNHGSRDTPTSQPTTRPNSAMSEDTLPESDQINPKGKRKKKLSFKEAETAPKETAEETQSAPAVTHSPPKFPFRIRKRSKSPEVSSVTSLDVSSLNVEDLQGPESDDVIVTSPTEPEPDTAPTLSNAAINTTLQQPGTEQDVLASELRNIVRREVRKIVEAQHQGIIAMLGALDDGSTPHGDARGLGGSREDRLSSAGQEYTVMSVHAVDETNPKSSVDVEVTPLPSDAFSLDEDDPLTMSDLGKGLAQPRAAGGALNGALRELRQMENLHIRDQKPPPEKQAQWGGKENQIPWHLSQQQQGEPFARVMATLRHINHNVLGVPQRPGAPTVPYLLHAPPTSSSTPLHLPIIPTTAPAPAPVYQPQVSSVAPAPLLYQPSPQQQVDQLPVRDHTSMPFFRPPPAAPQPQFAGFRMPLLQFHGRTAPMRYPHLEDHRGTPHLIPPNLVFPHGQPTEDIPKMMPSQEPLGARLLSGKPPQPPVPTVTAEVRNDGKRRQRRELIESMSMTQSLQRTTTDNYTEPDLNLSLTSQEDHGVQVDEPEKDTITEGVQTSARSSRRQSVRDDDHKPEEPLHPGYALTPGMFDEYLKAEAELGSAADTHAKLQYKAVMGTKKDETRSTAMQTEGPSFREDEEMRAQLSGSQAVDQAIAAYASAKKQLGPGGMLPPDVYLGLTFGDTGTETGGSGGRAFINVVDMGSDAVSDLASMMPGHDEVAKPRKPSVRSTSPVRQPPRSSLTERAVRMDDDEDVERLPGPDPVTAQMLLRREAERLLETYDDTVQNCRLRTRNTIRQRLNDMNAQFSAIEAMSGHMEEDFQNTKLLMNTIEHLGDAIDPNAPRYPAPRAWQDPEEPPPEEPEVREDEAVEDEVFTDRPPLKPSDVKRFAEQDKQESDKIHPPEELDDNGLTTEERVRDIKERLGQSTDAETTLQDSKLDLTGLSGVSDIVGELLTRGGLEAQDLGLSEREMQQLAKKARDTSGSQSPTRTSIEIKKAKQRTEEERQELRAWMERRREEQNKSYKKHVDSLRQAEARPFVPPTDAQEKVMPQSEFIKREQERQTEKQHRDADALRWRQEQASHLMSDLLTDRLELPPEKPVIPVSPGTKRRSSPARKGQVPTTPTKSKRIIGTTRHVSRSPERRYANATHDDLDRMDINVEDYSDIRDSHEYVPLVPQQAPDRSGLSTENTLQSGSWRTGTSGVLGAYTQQLAEVDEIPEDTFKDSKQPSEASKEPSKEPPARPAPTRPYTDLVRLQRPHVTRQKKGFVAKPQSYVERLSQTGGGSTYRSNSSMRSQPSIYGTKRIPGSAKAAARTAPRTVKTYHERLADMKGNQTPRGTVHRQPAKIKSPGRSLTMSMQSQSTPRKQRKPMTYAQQLQALQPPKEMYRTGENTMTPRTLQRTMTSQRRGPAHKPKTYVEKLQELQPVTPRSERSRVTRRSRPYQDPYSIPEEDITFSDVSPWSVDADVRNILRDSNSTAVPSASMAATEDDGLSAFSEGDLELGADYTNLVDIQAIEDAMSEGSILSFIDWDQVDQLIANVE